MEEIIAYTRTDTGKSAGKVLRKQKKIPAVIYNNSDNINIFLDEHDIEHIVYRAEFLSSIFKMKVGKDKYKVLPKDIDYHPVTDKVIHIDFMQVVDNKPVEAPVCLRVLNKNISVGIKMGGSLNMVKRKLLVRSLPSDLPKYIDIDVRNLKVKESIRLNQVELPKGVKAVSSVNETLLAIAGRRVETDTSTSESSEDSAEQAAV